MDGVADIIATQAHLFTSIDPLLPRWQAPPQGKPVAATLPDGCRVHGVLYRAVRDASSFERLWHPRVSWELTPLIGEAGAPGMAAVLAAAGERINDAATAADADSDVQLTWPSRDVSVIPVLLEHGFVPHTVLAVRTGTDHGTDTHDDAPGVLVRTATGADLEDLVNIEMAELHYSASVAGRSVPDNAPRLLAGALNRTLLFTGRVLIAEDDGVAVGAVDVGWASPVPGTSIEHRLAPGWWGYIGTLSVLPPARGTGIGSALTAAAHRVLASHDVCGTYLYYDLANPLSSVFWPRRGYRPLWTRWVCRPVTPLR